MSSKSKTSRSPAYVQVFNLKVPGVTREEKNYSLGIIDDDRPYNDFPEYLARILHASPTASACIRIVKDFARGNGFNLPEFGEQAVNVNETVQDLQAKLANDIGYLRRYALLIDWDLNELANGNLVWKQIYHLPVEWVRYGVPNDYGNVQNVVYNPFWNDSEERSNKEQKRYGLYTEDVEENIELFNWAQEHREKGDIGFNYKGHKTVYYWNQTSEIDRVYSKPDYFSSAENAMRTESELWKFHERNVHNNFFLGGFLTLYGDPTEQVQVGEHSDGTKIYENAAQVVQNDMAQMFAGGNSAGSVMILWQDNDAANAGRRFEPVNGNDNDKKFIELMEKTADSICTATQVPPILAGIQVSGKLGNANEKPEAILFMNQKTQVLRKELEKFWNTFFPQENEPIKIKTFEEYTTMPDSWLDRIPSDAVLEYIREKTGVEFEIATIQEEPQQDEPDPIN